jgi:hypothetical protein
MTYRMPSSQDIASSLVVIPETTGHMSDNITENPRSYTAEWHRFIEATDKSLAGSWKKRGDNP